MNNFQKLTLAGLLSIAAMMTTAATTNQAISATIQQGSCGSQGCNDSACAQPSCAPCSAPAPAPAIICQCRQSNCNSCLSRVRNVAVSTVSKIRCRCGKQSCRSCRPKTVRQNRVRAGRACGQCESSCGGVQCPSCDEDICRLELDKSDVEKSCFKVKQKTICIPPVRFPWQKCCPPGTSKTRIVNQLSVHKYECPSCSYQWKVEEAKVAAPPACQQAAPVEMQSYQVAPEMQPIEMQPTEMQPIEAQSIEAQPVDLQPAGESIYYPEQVPPAPISSGDSTSLPWRATTSATSVKTINKRTLSSPTVTNPSYKIPTRDLGK